MAALSTPRAQMAEGTRFAMNGKSGIVYLSRASACDVVWDEWVNPDTGEIFQRVAGHLKAEEIALAMARGRLSIVSLPPDISPAVGQSAAARAPRPKELERAAWRHRYVDAADSLIEEGRFRPRRTDFVLHLSDVIDLALEREIKSAAHGGKAVRGGQKVSVRRPPQCGETVFRWWSEAKRHGAGGCFDNYRQSGNRTNRFTAVEEMLAREVIAGWLTEERVSIAKILDAMQARFRLENRQRAELGEHVDLQCPGYDTVWSMIANMAPIDHKVRTRGMEVAYRDLHTLGKGLVVNRPLERVEIDEYTVDLMVFMKLLKLDTVITPQEKLALGLSGLPERLIISAAIDVYTGAIVALQIAPASSMNLAIRTIEMIYTDKNAIGSSVGAINPWPMHGHPQTIAFDRAQVNMSDEIYLRLASAGITNLALPAGKPFLKPWIERFFATLGAKFLQQFTGRTFSNVVLKGENDPAKRATISLEEFLRWLVRWIVDVHHTTKPQTLGRQAPLYAWQAAVAEQPPLVMCDDRRLRLAFGETLQRKVTRFGIEVFRLHYVADEISALSLMRAQSTLEIRWWHRKIGQIEVLMPDGRWVTAHCTDQTWAGKTLDDLIAFVASDNAGRARGQLERDLYAADADKRIKELAALRGLMPLAPTAETLAQRVKEFSRYGRVPGMDEEPAPGIFDDEVAPFGGPAAAVDHQTKDTAATPALLDEGDIIE